MAIGDRPTVAAAEKAAAVADAIKVKVEEPDGRSSVEAVEAVEAVGAVESPRPGVSAGGTEACAAAGKPQPVQVAHSAGRPGPVVAGVGSESDRAVLGGAMELAARLGSDLVIAHAVVPDYAYTGLPAGGLAGPALVPAVDEPGEESQAWVGELASSLAAEHGYPELPISVRLGMGDAALVLADLAEDVDAFCIVVGSRGDGARALLSRILRPSVSRGLLRERRVPVLVVPDADGDDGA